MFQIDGKHEFPDVSARQSWMRLLSRAPLHMLEAALDELAGPAPQWLRRPEVGLVMAQARVGGSGARFNLGEVSVTRCALRLDPAVLHCEAVGVAYVLGRSPRHAELAATADALLQSARGRALLPPQLLPGIASWLEQQEQAQRCKAQATRVDFFTVARESDAQEEQP